MPIRVQVLPGSEAEEEEEKVPSEHNTETELVSGVSTPDLEVTLCRAVTCHYMCAYIWCHPCSSCYYHSMCY